MPKPKLIDFVCTSCGKQAEHKAKGLCSACYQRQKPPATRVRRLAECERCKRVKPFKGRGLCVTCHTLVYHPPKPGTCKRCHEDKPIVARGLCNACLHAERYVPRMVHPTCCSECGTEQKPFVRSLCRRCYDGARIRANGLYAICTRCQELRVHVAKGLCRNCYSATYASPRRQVACNRCGREAVTHGGLGYCVPCYQQEMRPLRRLAQRRRYATDPAFRHRAVEAVRRYQRNLKGEHTLDEWHALLEVFEHRCAYCDGDIRNCAAKDHVVAVSKGGRNEIENIVPCCKSCNSRKGNRPVAEFVAMLHREREERERARRSAGVQLPG